MTEAPGLRRAALVVSSGILVSRILGFLRNLALFALLGRTGATDLYAAAFTVPDYLFFLMAGGYLSITLVPILSRHLAAGDEAEADRAFSAVFRLVTGAMAAITLALMALARRLTHLVFPEFAGADLDRLAGLMRIAFGAQVFFVAGTLLMAGQYARRRFVVPTLAPLVYNLGIILGGLAGAVLGDPSPEAFLWGGLIGAAAGNFGLQWWGAARAGVRLRRGVPVRHPAVGEYFSLALPLMIGQSAVALDEQWPRLFGQFGGEGTIAGLTAARQLNMLPVGVIAQAAGVAAYPFLARLVAEARDGAYRETLLGSARAALAVAGLASAVVVGLATPVVRLAYEYGEFHPADTGYVAPLLALFGLSIPFWAAHQVYTRGLYARRRMWLPVGLGTAVTAATVPALWWGVRAFGAAGVAAVSTVAVAASAAGVAIAWHRSESAPGREIAATALRVAAAAVAAGVAAWLLTEAIDPSTRAGSAGALVLGVLVAAVVYAGAGRAVGLTELDPLWRRLRRALNRGGSSPAPGAPEG